MKRAGKGSVNAHTSLMLLVVAAAGVAISLFAAAQIRSAEKERLRQHVRQRAHDLQVLLAGRVREYNLAAWYLRKSLLWIGPEDSRQFAATARGLLARFPELQAVEWSPRVKREQREGMEAALARAHPGFRITEPDGQAGVRPAGSRDEHCVIGLVEPFVGNERAVGLDLYQALTAALVKTARDEGRMMLSVPIRLVQEEGGSAGVVLYIPFYRGPVEEGESAVENRRERFGGVFQLVFRANDLFGKLLDSGIVRQVGHLPGPMPVEEDNPTVDRDLLGDLDLMITDRDAGQGRSLYYRPAPSRRETPEPPASGEFTDPVAASEEVHFAGRHWRLSVQPSPGAVAAHLSGVPAGVLASGLAFTLLLMAHLASERRRSGEIRQEVEDRTADLERSVRELKERHKRLKQVETTLTELGRLRVVQSDQLRPALEEVCCRLARGFGIDRVGVWLFDPEQKRLECQSESRLAPGGGHKVSEIVMESCPKYSEAISGHRVLSAVNAELDPRTAELKTLFAGSERIYSRLDAPIHKGGALVGVISHASERGHRRWSLEEETLAAAMGDFVGMLIVESERLAAEQRLRDSEQLYQSLVENLPHLVFRKDLDGRFTFANQRLAQALGRSAEDIVGRRDEELFPPEQARRFRDDDRKVIATGDALERVEEIELPTGTAFHHTSKTPLSDAAGRSIGVQGISWDVTERFRLQEALHASDERFRALVDRLDCIVWEADPTEPDWPFIFVSRQVEEMLGFPATLLIEEPDFWWRHVVDEDRERVVSSMRAALSAGEDRTLEYRVRSVDGRKVWVRDMVTMDTDAKGRVVALRGVMVDITEARRLEAELSVNAERMQIFIDRAPTAVAMFDREMRYLSASRRWYEQNGFREGSIVGRCHYDLVPDVPDRWRRIHRHCLEGNAASCDEDPFPRDGGGLDYVRWEIHPWHESTGAVGGIVMFAEIITERVKARLAIQQGEAILQATGRAAEVLLKASSWREAAPEVLEALGEASGSERLRFFEVSAEQDGLCSRLDWRRGGEPDGWLDGGAPVIPWRKAGWDRVRERLLAGTMVRGDFGELDGFVVRSLEAADGSVVFLLPVWVRGGCWGVLSFELVHPERAWSTMETGALKGAADNLTAAIERELATNERLELERSMREAQKLESLGVLAGGIAHDFNNLLTAIVGNAGLLRLGLEPDSTAAGSVDIIENTAMRASDLCRQLLAYAGKGRFEMSEVELNEVVRDTAALLRVSVSKKAGLEQSLGADILPVWADAAQLRQIVMNLVINASEAIGNRPGTISLRTGMRKIGEDELSEDWLGQSLSPGEHVFLQVSDDGCGMSPETLKRVFEPFFTTKFTGRGLGMAAVLGIVKGHHGALRVSSEEGKGTTFELLLPPTSKREPKVCLQTDEPVPDRWPVRRSVLIVEDEPDVMKVADAMLRKWGLGTTQAANGREAVAIFTAERGAFDLVLMDLTMPGLDGFEAAERMRALRPEVKILLVSGYDESGAVEERGALVNGFVQKPFRWTRLKAILWGLLK